jgi:ABC-type uncharacterized transport system substrate-binding protein
MRRREFIGILSGGVVAWPVRLLAQQSPMPLVGVLNVRAASEAPQLLAAFRKGLKDTGFVEGQNVAIEYRFADNQSERLPELANDLVRHQAMVIAATNTPAAIAAKAATTSIPIVFATAGNPVQLGLVASFNEPGGNVTGVSQLAVDMAPKRLELLHELLPNARTVALLVNPVPRKSLGSAGSVQGLLARLRKTIRSLVSSKPQRASGSPQVLANARNTTA